MLKVEQLYFRYSKRGDPVLKGASLQLKQGEIGILLGKNGSGKTTLFKNILGIEKPEGGSIQFDKIAGLFFAEKRVYIKWKELSSLDVPAAENPPLPGSWGRSWT